LLLHLDDKSQVSRSSRKIVETDFRPQREQSAGQTELMNGEPSFPSAPKWKTLRSDGTAELSNGAEQ